MSFFEYIQKKGEAYSNIDITRMPRVWDKYKEHFFLPKAIHIVGTNGKGSSSRALAVMLKNLGFKVGHYTSPHILRFNERIWIDGKNIDNDRLELLHKELKSILKDDADELSYFEYTTLLAFKAFEGLDYAVLEAGLGGEFDATSVANRELSLFTTIGFDHQHILGDTIKAIATTKLNSMAKSAIVGYQVYDEVYEIAKEIASKKGSSLFFAKDMLTKDEQKEIEEFVNRGSLGDFQNYNLALATAGLKQLGFSFDISLLDGFFMPGRLQRIDKNITIDVGHNSLSALMILKEFEGKKVVLIYNTLKDKDFKAIIKLLSPIIKRVELIELKNERAMELSLLKKELEKMGLEVDFFKEIKKEEEYLVYGSFYVINEFVRRFGCEIGI